MTRNTIFAALAAATTLISGQAFADGYLGTYGREQDNANRAPAYAVSETVRADNGTISARQSYGAPLETGSYLRGERDNVGAEQNPTGVYLGTARDYQDNADVTIR